MQAIWSALDDFDTGFDYTSALELGTKMYSRQCSYIKGAGINVSFAVDDPSFCAQSNQQIYTWALNSANPVTSTR